jgi:hypothetical protein
MNMGLDMYLSARLFTSEYSAKDAHVQLAPLAEKFLPPAGEGSMGSITISRDVAYWRKANQIHSWFVNNVQDGKDDCGTYDVSMEQLEELRGICVRIRDGSKMKKARIPNGYTVTATGKTPIMEDGEVIVDPTLAKELLPAAEGFFFGSTEYDKWYMEDIKDTIEQLDKIIAWCHAERCLTGKKYSEIDFQYHSSW